MKKICALMVFMLGVVISYAQLVDSTTGDTDTAKISVLKEVKVVGKKPAVQLFADRTIVNVESSITNSGATLLEVLSKSPGVSMDKSGNISLKGKQGVMIMIDGKPAQVSGTDLNNLLSGMTASQVERIELIDNPSAKYDAAGNAGIINVITKKTRQKGFNGNASLAFGQGRYSRSVNNVTFNRFEGKLNLFATVSANLNQNFTDLYALRTYYEKDNKTISSFLEQPSYFSGRAPAESLKLGFDFYATRKTTIGAVLTGMHFNRTTTGNNNAIWKNALAVEDSVINTVADNRDNLSNGGINVNAKHNFSETQELTTDFDFIGYSLGAGQHFTNSMSTGSSYRETISGDVPSSISILTGKADYSQTFAAGWKLESGWKSSHVRTNNRANYFYDDGSGVVPDLGKTNHFLYTENIHAAYLNAEKRQKHFTIQGGLRYENTSYSAAQLGNALRKDSSFSRRYADLFPSITASIPVDTNNSFSLSAARRIDRPLFQSLNPFVFVINKYTYQTGNPYYRPQYTWNIELSHSFKNMLVTTLSYSITRDYFSQIFLSDTTGIIYYTEGNLKSMSNIGLSESTQFTPAKWWSVSAQATLNYKKINGFVWNERRTALLELNLDMNNQFTFSRGWSAEISGVFSTRDQELQEITDPTGQLSAGISKQLFANKASVKFVVRDIFYTQAMKGITTFQQSTEYFKLTRDSRSATIAFSYRFGNASKNAARKTGGADDETRRVGNS